MTIVSELPRRIYLLPGTGDKGETTWCDSPAPGSEMDEADAVAYVRADVVTALRTALEQIVRVTRNPTTDGRVSDCYKIASRTLAETASA